MAVEDDKARLTAQIEHLEEDVQALTHAAAAAAEPEPGSLGAAEADDLRQRVTSAEAALESISAESSLYQARVNELQQELETLRADAADTEQLRTALEAAEAQARQLEETKAELEKQLVDQAPFGTLMVRTYPQAFGPEYADFPFGQVELLARDCTNEESGDFLFYGSKMEKTVFSLLAYSANATVAVRDLRGDAGGDDGPMLRHRATFLGMLKAGRR